MQKPTTEMDEVEMAYYVGFIAGLQAYAHWKDGQQFVGTTGRPLQEAVQKAQETWNYNPPMRVK